MTGGNFWEGAAIGAVVVALNHLGHDCPVDSRGEAVELKAIGLAGVAVYAQRAVISEVLGGVAAGLSSAISFAVSKAVAIPSLLLMPTNYNQGYRNPMQELRDYTLKAKKEEGKFKGGKQGKRDKDYGYFKDKDFKNWWHRKGKKEYGGKDFGKDKIDDIYNDWINRGKPNVK